MSENPTRRDVLKTAAVIGAIGSFAVQTAAGKTPTARIVEAGIRYEVPESEAPSGDEELQFVLPDSRPSYTVDEDREAFVLSKDAPDSLFQSIRRSGSLLDERTGEAADAVNVAPADGHVGVLPTELSARMRPKEALSLDARHRVPNVSLQWNSNAPAVAIESEGTLDLSPNSQRTVRLDPETVEATTVRRTDETVEVEGMPDHRQGPKRVFDSVTVEVTPVVEVVDHGELTLVRHPLA